LFVAHDLEELAPFGQGAADANGHGQAVKA
jgi:hypothetical protein